MSQDPVYAGGFVHSNFDDAKLSTGPDHGLSETESRYFDNDVTNPRVSRSDKSVQIRDYADASWLVANEPYMCRLGVRTGLSCGYFEEITNQYTVTFANITDQGDSAESSGLSIRRIRASKTFMPRRLTATTMTTPPPWPAESSLNQL